MKVALFVPCYVDQLAPQTAWAAVEVLERHGCEVILPREQTCCGQPLANAGYAVDAAPIAKHFLDVFEGYDHIVAPSASCVAMVRKHYHDVIPDDPRRERVASRVYELCEFLVDVLKVDHIAARFPRRVALHRACHGVRELGLATPSERVVATPHDKVTSLLSMVDGLELVPLSRADECCGFGGSFAVKEEAVSCSMGRDKLDAAAAASADVLTTTDTSCLLHLEGLRRREGRPLRTMHVAEILAGREPPQ
jgi:L-lactate dehydrogenase complex protein LldE